MQVLPRTAVLIPAWQPGTRLIPLVEALVASDVLQIVIVDDGSDSSCASIFQSLEKLDKVRLVRHSENLGKGRALKDGLRCILTSYPEVQAVVTADADGQHTAEDILRIASAFDGTRGFVLGTRTFRKGIPFRSRLGNGITSLLFRFLSGQKVADTQSGLRAFSRELLPELLDLEGERYEYEMNVLAHLCRRGIIPLEIPIRTVYFDRNSSSHFNPLLDSMRIYFVLLRFYSSALVSAAVDLLGFSLVYALTENLLLAFLVGRFSSLANFLLNRSYVFHSEVSVPESLWRYYALALVLGLASFGSIRVLSNELHWNMYVVKILVETLLSLVSFSVQRTFVFRGPQERSS